MPDPLLGQSDSGRWLIRVCSHGLRVEWRDNYDGWLHMDADASVCPADERPFTVEVMAVDESQRLRERDARDAFLQGLGNG